MDDLEYFKSICKNIFLMRRAKFTGDIYEKSMYHYFLNDATYSELLSFVADDWNENKDYFKNLFYKIISSKYDKICIEGIDEKSGLYYFLNHATDSERVALFKACRGNMSNYKDQFYKIISYEYDKNSILNIHERHALHYFLIEATDSERALFLDTFPNYVVMCSHDSRISDDRKYALMSEVYYLYDDPFSLLALFAELDGDLYDNVYMMNFHSREFYYELYNKIKNYNFFADYLLKDALIDYREDRDFCKSRENMIKKYGNIDKDILEKNYNFYLTLGNLPEQNIFRFFSLRGISDRIQERGYNPVFVFQLAYTYALKYLNIDKEVMKQYFNPPRANQVLLQFIKIGNFSDISSLKRLFTSFSSSYYKNGFLTPYDLSIYFNGNSDLESEFDKMYKEVFLVLDKDSEYAREKYDTLKKRMHRNKIQSMIDKVDFASFLSDTMPVHEYCAKKGISIHEFNEALSYASDDVKEKVSQVKLNNKAHAYAVLISTVDSISNKIIHGVTLDDDSVRDFDYLDYRLATTLDGQKFIKLAKEIISGEDLKKVISFFHKNRPSGTINIKQELEGEHFLNVNGVVHEVTEEEKLFTMEFLKGYGLGKGGIDRKLYAIALKRCVNGNLFQNNDSKKKQK